jgi:hypothetical protein
MRTKLTIQKIVHTPLGRRKIGRPASWWIKGLPGGYGRAGPYDTYQEALEDKDGMSKIFDDEDYK